MLNIFLFIDRAVVYREGFSAIPTFAIEKQIMPNGNVEDTGVNEFQVDGQCNDVMAMKSRKIISVNELIDMPIPDDTTAFHCEYLLYHTVIIESP